MNMLGVWHGCRPLASTHVLAFSVSGLDAAGNQATASAACTVAYGIALRYDPGIARHPGTYPIRIALVDALGMNVSSPDVVCTAVGVSKTSDAAPGPVDDQGNANPDGQFRYGEEMYIFNLRTKELTTGTYALSFVCGNDPTLHEAPFQIK